MSVATYQTQYVYGYAERGGASEIFTAILSNNGNLNSTSSLQAQVDASSTPNRWQSIRRGFISMNPSGGLPVGAVIDSATITLTPTGVTDNFSQSLCLTSAVLAAHTTIASSDYQGTNSSKTEYAPRVALSAMSVGVGTVMTFNATGRAYLQTQLLANSPIILGLRLSGDIDIVEPTWSDVTANVTMNVGASEPVITVNYHIGPGHAVLLLTGTLGNSADTVMANLWTVEVFT